MTIWDVYWTVKANVRPGVTAAEVLREVLAAKRRYGIPT